MCWPAPTTCAGTAHRIGPAICRSTHCSVLSRTRRVISGRCAATAADSLHITPALAASSGETLRHLALTGQGVVCLSDFMTRVDIKAGRLVPLMEDYATGFRQQIHALYYRNTQLAQRINCFLDFLQQKL